MIKTEEELEALRCRVEAELGRRSLAKFIRLAWDLVEPNPLIWGWHIDAMAEHLTAVTAGQIRNLLICVPPGCMKSLTVATFWPAWEWILDPTIRYIFTSYQQDLSNKNAKLHRDLVLEEWFQRRWGAKRQPVPEADLPLPVEISKSESRKINLFANTAKGFRYSVGMGGAVTGRHGDRLVFDDLAKAQDAEGKAAVRGDAIKKANDFWFKVMATRKATESARKVGIMQRLHHDDPAGRCIDSGDYVSLILPMEYDPDRKCVVEVTGWEDPRTEEGELLWPARFSDETVEELRRELGSMTAAAQLDQNPSPKGGAVFQALWMGNRWESVPERARLIITVDCTFKDSNRSDYVVIQVWGHYNGHYYLVDQDRGKWGITKTKERILAMKAKHRRTVGVYIEDKANGPAIFQMLREEGVSGVVEWNPGRNSKEERAEATTPLWEAGNVWLPPDSAAPWIAKYIAELTKFPVDKHDDQVDATTMALLILHRAQHSKQKSAYAKMAKGVR